MCCCRLVCVIQERASLLYNGSRDGWTADDFFRCCSNKGPTLTLIEVSRVRTRHIRAHSSRITLIVPSFMCCDGLQAAGTGFVLGAYTAVSYPSRPALGADAENVEDEFGLSFLFSLSNADGCPFRLSLFDRKCAIRVTSTGGPIFGGLVQDADHRVLQFPNLELMHNGESANSTRGNTTNDHSAKESAYRLDTGYGPLPKEFKLDFHTLAGQEYFAAENIACYSL
jgi:hypothetical protein